MGKKRDPRGARLGINREWNSMWYSKRRFYAGLLESDAQIRQYIHANCEAVSRVLIARSAVSGPGGSATVTIRTARPANIIRKSGEGIKQLKENLSKLSGHAIQIHIEEVRKPEIDALLVAEGIAQQLEKRVMFRRAMKRAVSNAMRAGAEGIKVSVSGRLGGAEIARREWYSEGRIPLHTLRANIDYGVAEAKTTYGIIGVKVWIFKGEIIPGQSTDEQD